MAASKGEILRQLTYVIWMRNQYEYTYVGEREELFMQWLKLVPQALAAGVKQETLDHLKNSWPSIGDTEQEVTEEQVMAFSTEMPKWAMEDYEEGECIYE